MLVLTSMWSAASEPDTNTSRPVSVQFSSAIIALNLVAPLVCSQYANAVMQGQDEGGGDERGHQGVVVTAARPVQRQRLLQKRFGRSRRAGRTVSHHHFGCGSTLVNSNGTVPDLNCW